MSPSVNFSWLFFVVFNLSLYTFHSTAFVDLGFNLASNPFLNVSMNVSQSTTPIPEKQCSFKSIGVVCVAEAHYRSYDGVCNNLLHPWWGTTNIPFRRLMNSNYADGIFMPRATSVTGAPLPSPRAISNTCSKETTNSTEPLVNSLFTSFAQLIDHDLSSTASGKDDDGLPIRCQCQEEIPNPFCLNIPTPDMPDQSCIVFPRSSDFFQRDLACHLAVREQVNQINSFLDASMVYGSTKKKVDELRTFTRGQLKTTGQDLPPQAPTENNEGGSCLGAQAHRGCFLCGDTRANENMGLTSLHTLFIRLHNRLAASIFSMNPHWPEDVLFFETRRLVGAILQHITYNEFLPALIGSSRSRWDQFQYDPTVDPTISNEFATAAFRFGHTLVNGFMRRFNHHHLILEEIPLPDVIFTPAEAYNHQKGGLDTLLLGLLLTPSSKFDPVVADTLRNHLFEAIKRGNPPVETKRLDLLAVNINRGRDHGLPTYNAMRQFCGLRRASSFDDLKDTIETSVIGKLSSVYAHVEDIDLYMGGLSERSISDGVVGPTFACIIALQFDAARRGDRFFYTTTDPNLSFTPEQLQEIQGVTLSGLLCQTIDGMREVQRHALKLTDRFNNPYLSCSSIPPLNLTFWRE